MNAEQEQAIREKLGLGAPVMGEEAILNTLPTPQTDGRVKYGQYEQPLQSPTNLRALHHEIIRLTVLGWKGTEIAKALNITNQSVSNCLGSYKAKNLIRLMTVARTNGSTAIQNQMRENLPMVHEVLFEGIMDDDTPVAVRLKEAREYMGMCGIVKPQYIQAQSISAHLTMDEIIELKKRAHQRAVESGLIVEPTTIEDSEVRVGPMESEGDSQVVDGEWSETESDGL